MTLEQATSLVQQLLSLFPNPPRQMGEDLAKLAKGYAALLCDLDPAATAQAILALARRQTFFPAIAEIRAEVQRLTGQRPPCAETALLEVHEVRKRRRDLAGREWKLSHEERLAAWAEIRYSHPLVEQIATRCRAADVHADMHERTFLAAYREAAEEQVRKASLPAGEKRKEIAPRVERGARVD